MSLKKDYEAVVKEAEKQGFRKVRKGNNSKYMLLAPDGKGKVWCAASPSEYRGLANLISDLRKCGFKWKGR